MATLDNVSIDISVVLGRTAMPIRQVLRLGRGAIIELDSSEEDEVRILANNMPVARGMVISSAAIASRWKSKSCCPVRRKWSNPPLCVFGRAAGPACLGLCCRSFEAPYRGCHGGGQHPAGWNRRQRACPGAA